MSDQPLARVSDKEMDQAYSYLFSHALPNHGLYAGFNRRAGFFVEWIKEHVPQEGLILDAGCGRGFLVKWLLALGYNAEGTDIASWLFGPRGDLYGLPVIKMPYGDFHKFPGAYYTAVVSSDVLEHLQTEEEVVEAFSQLVRISKGPVLVSTGGIKQAHNPFPDVVKFPVKGLHFVVRPKDWWRTLYTDRCTIDKEFDAAGSYFMLGWKK